MIQLHQYPRAGGLPNMSPFCMKLETYLRLAEIPYEHVSLANPQKAPKGKGPFIVDGEKTIADSGLIIAYLKSAYGDPLGEGLPKAVRAQHHALERMLAEHTYFIVVAERWIEPENAERVKMLWFSEVPALLRNFVFGHVQRNLRRTLKGQGILRHTREERLGLLEQDLNALNDNLGDNAFFGGDAPREVDATTHAFLAAMLTKMFPGPALELVQSYTSLVAYNDRMGARVFPDFFGDEKS